MKQTHRFRTNKKYFYLKMLRTLILLLNIRLTSTEIVSATVTRTSMFDKEDRITFTGIDADVCSHIGAEVYGKSDEDVAVTCICLYGLYSNEDSEVVCKKDQGESVDCESSWLLGNIEKNLDNSFYFFSKEQCPVFVNNVAELQYWNGINWLPWQGEGFSYSVVNNLTSVNRLQVNNANTGKKLYEGNIFKFNFKCQEITRCKLIKFAGTVENVLVKVADQFILANKSNTETTTKTSSLLTSFNRLSTETTRLTTDRVISTQTVTKSVRVTTNIKTSPNNAKTPDTRYLVNTITTDNYATNKTLELTASNVSFVTRDDEQVWVKPTKLHVTIVILIAVIVIVVIVTIIVVGLCLRKRNKQEKYNVEEKHLPSTQAVQKSHTTYHSTDTANIIHPVYATMYKKRMNLQLDTLPKINTDEPYSVNVLPYIDIQTGDTTDCNGYELSIDELQRIRMQGRRATPIYHEVTPQIINYTKNDSDSDPATKEYMNPRR